MTPIGGRSISSTFIDWPDIKLSSIPAARIPIDSPGTVTLDTPVEDVAQLALRAADLPPEKVKNRIFYAATGQPLHTAGDVADIVRSQISHTSIEIGPGPSGTDKLEIRYRGMLSIEKCPVPTRLSSTIPTARRRNRSIYRRLPRLPKEAIQVNTLNELFSLKGKTALVTGASGGIGRELAAGLAGAGAAAAAVHRRNILEMEETQHAIESSNGRSILLPGDLRELAAFQKLINDTVSQLGQLDILVNCAGMNRRKPITNVTEDDSDTINNVNFKSLFFLSQFAHARMRQTAVPGRSYRLRQ